MVERGKDTWLLQEPKVAYGCPVQVKRGFNSGRKWVADLRRAEFVVTAISF